MTDHLQDGNSLLANDYSEEANKEINELKLFAPDFMDYIIKVGLGQVWSRDTFSQREKEIMAISSLINIEPNAKELRDHFDKALNIGFTVDELKEILHFVMIYCGIPRALGAMELLFAVAKKRGLV